LKQPCVRPALTLIELMVVLALMAFVAATATVTLTSRLSLASLNQGVSLWEFTDSQVRQQARRKGRRFALRIDIGSNQFSLTDSSNSDEKLILRSLGRGNAITRYRSATREVAYGPLQIEYSDEGTTETFAIEITGGRGVRWIVLAGITGQAIEVSDEKEVEAILSVLSPSSVHAG
jgi:prepilin-type N-terminal cleavage/methylation domain-containing protein